jgi:succinate dehydrogenase/fumarate reductase flavoprotein subunit
MPDLVVAGAGMAGLVAAARARGLGASVLLLEKLDRPGGSMRLSSGMVWRHRELDRFRAECPGGDERLQRLLLERMDDGVRWLEQELGAPVLERTTGNPLTTGVRFDPEGLTGALARAAGEVRLRSPLVQLPERSPVVLATGGFAADRELLREHVTPEAGSVLIRAAPGGTGDGLRLGLEAGARLTAGMGEIYGRNMPAPPARVEPRDFVRLAQLYARHAEVTGSSGERHQSRTWSEVDVVQWTARQPSARAWYRVGPEALGGRVRDRSVRDMVEAAAAAGAPVRREPGGGVTVETVAGVTTTLGGLATDPQARAAPGVFACGADTGGVATGGYASGLAAALVFGRIAAEAALEAG